MKTEEYSLFDRYYHFDLPPEKRQAFERNLLSNAQTKARYEQYKKKKEEEFKALEATIAQDDFEKDTALANPLEPRQIEQELTGLLEAVETIQTFAQYYTNDMTFIDKKGFEIMLTVDTKLKRQYLIYEAMMANLEEEEQEDIAVLCSKELINLQKKTLKPFNNQEVPKPRNRIILHFIAQIFPESLYLLFITYFAAFINHASFTLSPLKL